MQKIIYLTIDDGPSCNTKEKVEYLQKRNIPAIFYCRGSSIKKYQEHVVEAIRAGFLIGNHSYSHPYFSTISLEECYNEITETEKLIDECYALAGKIRPCKIIRLPFGDRGAGPYLRKPVTDKEHKKYKAIQDFLIKEGFKKVNFGGLEDEAVDSPWSFDTEDYKKRFIADKNLYMHNVIQKYTNALEQKMVMLLHDFDDSHHLFIATMDFLQSQEASLVTPDILV